MGLSGQQVRVAGLLRASVVDGIGVRFVVFFQGCTHGCIGCQNPDTHSMDGGVLYTTAQILDQISRMTYIQGVTLSGGDPFFQPDAALAIAKGTHAIGKDVWCYTGYTFEQLFSSDNARHLALLSEVDVLVDGRFILEQRSLDCRFRGSTNQRLIDVPRSLASGRAIELELSD